MNEARQCVASQRDKDWFSSKDACERSCDVECSPCKLSGSNEVRHVCFQTPHEEVQTVYDHLQGGGKQIIVDRR